MSPEPDSSKTPTVSEQIRVHDQDGLFVLSVVEKTGGFPNGVHTLCLFHMSDVNKLFISEVFL